MFESPTSSHTKTVTKKCEFRDFPGGPVVKTSPSNAGGVGSIPGKGSRVRELGSHVPWGQNPKNIRNRSKIVTSSIKTKKKKKGPHQKRENGRGNWLLTMCCCSKC